MIFRMFRPLFLLPVSAAVLGGSLTADEITPVMACVVLAAALLVGWSLSKLILGVFRLGFTFWIVAGLVFLMASSYMAANGISLGDVPKFW